MTSTLLEVDGIQLRFGGVLAINDVSFSVTEGELFAIIGPNGAGKTSIFNSISQVYIPQIGEIRWKGRSLRGLRPDKVASLGIARTFQNIELFPQMTVIDNLLLGRHARMQRSWLAGSLWWGPAKKEELANRRKVEDIIVDINKQGTSVLLIEQNATMALSIADVGYIMETGKIVMDGPASKLLKDEDVKEFYLGLHGDGEGGRKSFTQVKHYKRRKRWLS